MRPALLSSRDPQPSAAQVAAARQALALCANVDALARDAEVALANEDHRLLALLEMREEMLQDLAEQLVILRHERPTADSALFAATEQVIDDADALVAEVCSAVNTSHRVTMALAAKVARRSDEIRVELDTVQRMSSAGIGYGAQMQTRLVDRVR
jgi:hypothetical protein